MKQESGVEGKSAKKKRTKKTKKKKNGVTDITTDEYGSLTVGCHDPFHNRLAHEPTVASDVMVVARLIPDSWSLT